MRKKYSRKYDKRVSIISTGLVSDGFGGQISSGDTELQKRWCKVSKPDMTTASAYKNDYGLKASDQVLLFVFRAFDFDIKTWTLLYKGKKYSPLAVEDKDQYNVETVIVAQYVG